MDFVLDRLRLLDYHREFRVPRNLKPLDNDFFRNPVAQQATYYFELFGWLADEALGRKVSPSLQFDSLGDPAAQGDLMLKLLNETGLPTLEFSATKLRLGHGGVAIAALKLLADCALNRRNLNYNKTPAFLNPQEEHEDVLEDTAQVADVEDEIAQAELENDSTLIDFSKPSAPSPRQSPPPTYLGDTTAAKPASGSGVPQKNNAPKSDADTAARIDALLSAALKSNKNNSQINGSGCAQKKGASAGGVTWRDRLRDVRALCKALVRADCALALKAVSDSINKAASVLASREKYINGCYPTLLQERSDAARALAELRSSYTTEMELLSSQSSELGRLGEALERTKATMDELGTSMTDSKPLITIKAAVQKLRGELRQIDIRIAVLQHSLLQHRLRSKTTALAAAVHAAGRGFGRAAVC